MANMILECIGCRQDKVFIDFDPYPVCPNCREWERQKFEAEHEEVYLIRREERLNIHDGYRPGGMFKSKPMPKRPYVPDGFRWAIFERDNFTCQICGVRQYLTVDHIHAFSKGGELTFENCQTLCRSCNSRKGAN